MLAYARSPKKSDARGSSFVELVSFSFLEVIMLVELYTSLSANGLMLHSGPNHAPPAAVLADFISHVRTAGSLIVGRVTYDLMRQRGAAFPGIDLVVVSDRVRTENDACFVSSPRAALEHLELRGRSRVVLGGGGALYRSFLDISAVNELTLNVLPILGTHGQSLTMLGKPRSLRLLTSAPLTNEVTQLRFAVEDVASNSVPEHGNP